MSGWPLDGMIVFVLLALGLICLIASPLFNLLRKNVADVPAADGSIHMKPLPSVYAICAGAVLVCACTTYAALQAGGCFNMTADENTQNQLIGLGLSVAFWLGTAYMIHLLLLTTFRFDRHSLYRRTPMGGETAYDFEKLADIIYRGHDLRLRLQDGSKVTLPQSGRRGLIPFAAVFNDHVLRHTPPPPAPLQDKSFFATLPGQRVVAGFFSLDQNWLPQLRAEITGTFEQADMGGVTIRTDDGRLIAVPANLRGLGKRAAPPEDTLPENGLPPAAFSIAYFIAEDQPIPAGLQAAQ